MPRVWLENATSTPTQPNSFSPSHSTTNNNARTIGHYVPRGRTVSFSVLGGADMQEESELHAEVGRAGSCLAAEHIAAHALFNLRAGQATHRRKGEGTRLMWMKEENIC